jgi:hypothetical protein
VFIYHDQTALNDSYSKLKPANLVNFAAKSPVVFCTTAAGNRCLPAELQIYQVPDAAEIAKYSPYQLNEFTFAMCRR